MIDEGNSGSRCGVDGVGDKSVGAVRESARFPNVVGGGAGNDNVGTLCLELLCSVY